MYWMIAGIGMASVGYWRLSLRRLHHDCEHVMCRLEARPCRFGVHQLAYDLHISDHRAMCAIRQAVAQGRLTCRRLPDGSFGVYRPAS